MKAVAAIEMNRSILKKSPEVADKVQDPILDRSVNLGWGAMEGVTDKIEFRHVELVDSVYESVGYAAGSQDY